MVNQTIEDEFFPVCFKKVYPPYPSQEAQVDERVKKEHILQHNKKLALVKHSKSEDYYIFGTISVKDDKCYEIQPVNADASLIELNYRDLKELIVQTKR